MKKWTIYLYALTLGTLLLLLQAVEYRYLVRDLSVEVYLGTVAILFTFIGSWVGWKLTKSPTTQPVLALHSLISNPIDTDLTTREIEVLRLIAAGHSNQEIADKLYLSLNTIKKHNSALFQKLGVVRRTQAIDRAKQLGLLQ